MNCLIVEKLYHFCVYWVNPFHSPALTSLLLIRRIIATSISLSRICLISQTYVSVPFALNVRPIHLLLSSGSRSRWPSIIIEFTSRFGIGLIDVFFFFLNESATNS